MSLHFEDIYGYTHITSTEIARGGQGAVFRTQNPNVALKIEFDQSGLEFSKDITHNIKLNDIRLLPIPNKTNITLPQATLKGIAGYVMTLLDDMDSFENIFAFSFNGVSEYTNTWLDNFRDSSPDFVNVMGQYIASGGRRRRLNAYLKAASIMSLLHSSGLVYCDFSSRNAFISKLSNNNEVWLIDADNLNYQEKTKLAGYYTPGYGAPEVIKGKGCTFYSDAYAFAVSLFWLLTGTHPFKGQLLEENFDDDFADDAEEKAYAGELPWIMDEDDNSNYVDAQVQQQLVVSDRLMRYFNRTFSELGRKKRQTRPTMFEWSYILAKELDQSVRCKYCEMDYDASHNKCPWCDTENRIVEFKAYNQKEIWKYTHEIVEEESVSIPYRLLHGFRVKEIHDRVFCFKYEGNSLVISDLNENYEWSVSTDNGETYLDIYGRSQISGDCIMKCNNKLTKDTIIIEVVVK